MNSRFFFPTVSLRSMSERVLGVDWRLATGGGQPKRGMVSLDNRPPGSTVTYRGLAGLVVERRWPRRTTDDDGEQRQKASEGKPGKGSRALAQRAHRTRTGPR
jgi:hypothetical protein